MITIAKIDAANPVLAANARDPAIGAIRGFAKAYAKALRGQYRAKGPTSADERANASFRTSFRLVTFAGSTSVFTNGHGGSFRVTRTANAAGGDDHVVDGMSGAYGRITEHPEVPIEDEGRFTVTIRPHAFLKREPDRYGRAQDDRCVIDGLPPSASIHVSYMEAAYRRMAEHERDERVRWNGDV